MKNQKNKPGLRSFLLWVLWVLVVQIVLINLSAALYADKLTQLQVPPSEKSSQPVSQSIFTKTWRLFTGPTLYKQVSNDDPGFCFSSVGLQTKSGIPIEAWYVPTDSARRGTVVLLHGLTGNKGVLADEATAFRNLGYNVMLVDLRSHGHSGGKATAMGYKEAEEVALAFDYVKRKGETNIFIWGTSMGAVAAMKAVSDYQLKPSGIIIEMPFLSLRSHLEGRARSLGFPREPFGVLTSFWMGVQQGFYGPGFKTTRYSADITCPVLMQYGEKDNWVRREETDQLFHSILSSNKKLVLYEGAGHESLLHQDPVTWKREVAAFLDR